MVTSDSQGRTWGEAIDKLRDRFYIFDNSWGDRTAFVSAMDRDDGHKPFRRAYGDQADLVESTVHELWSKVLMEELQDDA
jgi:hypothetical protein